MRAKTRFLITRRELFCVAVLLLVHAISLIVLYCDHLGFRAPLIGRHGFVMGFGIIPPIVLAFVFGLWLHSWRYFGFWLLVFVVAWQVEFLLLDWLAGRLTDPFWLRENSLRFTREIIARFLFPTVSLSAGALLSLLKRKRFFTAPSRHA